MDDLELQRLIGDVASGACHPDEAVSRLRRLPFAELGYAKVDHHRALRQGRPEAVYAPGKTPEQCAGIVEELLSGGSGPVLVTRASPEQASACLERNPGGEKVVLAPVANSLSVLVWRPAAPHPGRV
ncbi:MAG: nickel pincer cofactor biosynthesis protein LarB, partial [Acidimicrobiales bacterium]